MRYNHFDMLPERAFLKVGGKIMPQGGGSSTPTQTTNTTTTIPEYARPYVESTLGKAAAVTDINQNPYQPYKGQQVATFTPMQEQAFRNVGSQQIAPQIADASNIAYQTGQYGLGTQGTAAQLQNAALGYGAMAAGAGDRYAQQATNPAAAQAYMNPYLQASLQPALQEVQRQYDITGAQQMGNASRSGAFGGSREALMAAENQRNKNIAMNQMIGQGYNIAFDKANQAQQFGANLGLQGLQAGQQGVQGAVGAGQYGLQGLGQAGASAGTLGQLGQTQFSQEQAANQAMVSAGTQQQAMQQKGLDAAYQQYQAQLNYPYQQIGFMSDLLRGLPLTQQSQSMYQNPSMISQAAGLGTAGMGMYGMYNMMNKADGGQIKEQRMADGGITQLFDVGGSVKTDLSRMSPQDLQEYIAESSSPTAKRMAQQILAEKTFMARLQQNPGVTQLPSNLPTGEPMAGGGIIAFAEGDRVESSDSSGDTRVDAESRTDTESILARLIASAGEGDNIRPIPGSEMAQAGPTSDATPVAIPVAAPAPTTGAVLPPQNAGVDSLVARPPTRLPAAGATPAVPALSTYGGIPTMSPEAKEAFSQYAQLYKDMRGDNKKAREEAKYMALIQAGFGIAGGTSPNAFANINQGVQPAMAQYQSAIKDIRKDDREAVKGLIDLGLSKEQFLQKAQQMGIDVYKADRVYDAHIYSADATVRAANARAAGEKQPRSITEGDITDKQIQNGILIDRLTEKAKTGPLTDTEKAALANAQSSNKYYMSILETKRPVAPSAAIPTAITGAEKASGRLRQLRLEYLIEENPKKKLEIETQIKETEKEIADFVKANSSPGRGIPATNTPTPTAGANSAGAAGANPPAIAPPTRAIEALKNNPTPQLIKEFDAKYGVGAAARLLK